MTDEELLSYVLISQKVYQGSIRALQSLDIISDILDRAPEKQIPNLIRIVLGKQEVKE